MTYPILLDYTPRWENGKPVPPWSIQFEGRPLVVIDPEDREQVERLASAYMYASITPRVSRTDETTDKMQAALRSLVTPPRPDEPTGLGAVVEDEDGALWVLYTHPDNTAPWTEGSTSVEWPDITAVRILSEGIKP